MLESQPAPPPPSTLAPPSKVAPDPVRTYLALLAESATSISALSSSSLALTQAKLAYDRAILDAPVLLPSWDNSLSGAARTLAALEAVGQAVGLDAYHDRAENGPTVQLSLGGKCSAVDVTIDGATGAVSGAKVLYFLPEPVGHRESEAVAAEVQDALRGLGDGAAGTADLRGFMGVLREVRRLDLLAEGSGRDGFRQATAFATELAAAVASSLASEGGEMVPIPLGKSISPEVIFHASPLAKNCPEWEAAAAGGWRDGSAVETVTKAGGVNVVRVTLEEAAVESAADGDP